MIPAPQRAASAPNIPKRSDVFDFEEDDDDDGGWQGERCCSVLSCSYSATERLKNDFIQPFLW